MQKEIHDKTGHAGGAQVQVEPFKELVGERWREEAVKGGPFEINGACNINLETLDLIKGVGPRRKVIASCK